MTSDRIKLLRERLANLTPYDAELWRDSIERSIKLHPLALDDARRELADLDLALIPETVEEAT